MTEQYYLRARYYNPVLGRFMQEDVYQGDGLNLYVYCGNNPVVYYDPSGYAGASQQSGYGCPPNGNIGEGGRDLDFSTASSYGIDMDNLNFSNTVQNQTGRPYQDSNLLINEIIESKSPVPDPRGTNAWSWTVEGTFNGSTGFYELVIDPQSNTVWHFLFKSQ